jgi:uncharacterized protein YciU (UPF0263 family)
MTLNQQIAEAQKRRDEAWDVYLEASDYLKACEVKLANLNLEKRVNVGLNDQLGFTGDGCDIERDGE